MSNTVTPARRLTPVSIWSSFLSSNKRHIIITGGRGSGKTTLLCALFPKPLRGVTTFAEPKKAVYLRENGAERAVTVGIYDDSLPGKENKMRPCAEAFSSEGRRILQSLSECEDEWVSVDEIGYLETECPEYCKAIERLMERKRLAAAVRKQDIPFLRSLLERDDVFLVDLDAPFGNMACVIMASGMGIRFGGNKLMADFCGEPLILRAVAATEGIFEKRIVVTRHSEVAKLCRSLGVETILHDLPHRNDTVRLGIDASGRAEACAFCQGDQPLLKCETVKALALAARNNRNDILRLGFEGEQGAPVIFPSWAFGELSELPQGKGGGYLIKKYPERLRTVSAFDGSELMDADTPEDLARLEKMAKSLF